MAELGLNSFGICQTRSDLSPAHFISTSPLTNVKLSRKDKIQTQLWMATLIHKSGISSPEQIMVCMEDKLHLDHHDCTGLERYLAGERHASTRRGPCASGVWVQRAEIVWPGTAQWFTSPLWFLLQEKPVSLANLLTCVNSLPPLYSDDLLAPTYVSSKEEIQLLNPVLKDYVYTFTDSLGPWSLGALACAMRSAEFNGEPGTSRWAAVGILWEIDQLLSNCPAVMHLPLMDLRMYAMDFFSGSVHAGQRLRRTAITDEDVTRFAQERVRFLDYFGKCEFDKWDINQSPPWTQSSVV